MEGKAPEKKTLIEKILERELRMFQGVRSAVRASCQDDPERFALMRGAQFSAWSEKTLGSYLDDLAAAESEGRNLMTLKYARMDDLIPPLTESPLVESIADEMCAWQRELAGVYPALLGRGRRLSGDEAGEPDTSFYRYITGELETYSEQTLQYLWDDVSDFKLGGRNMSEAITLAMVRGLGYATLAEAEDAQRRR